MPNQHRVSLLWLPLLLVLLSGLVPARAASPQGGPTLGAPPPAPAPARAEAAAGTPSLPTEAEPLDPIGLPEVLSDADAALYREIFELQRRGKWKTADKRIKKLGDRVLMGHVLAQRYLHPTAYRSKYMELKRWMGRYADHPQARQIYKLALKRRPKNYKMPRRPVAHDSAYSQKVSYGPPPYRSTKRLTKKQRREARRIKWQVRRHAIRTRLTVAENLLKSKRTRRLLDHVELDDGYTDVASAWFYYGRPERAFALADPAAKRSGQEVPIAHWIAGLAAWQLGKMPEAAKHFEQLALSQVASDWNSAAGAYWAARSHLKLGQPEKVSRWLKLGARSPLTFYGLLSRRALGVETRFDFSPHELTENGIRILMETKESRRALALLQAGQRHRAERELLRLRNWTEPKAVEALLGVAERTQMPALSFRLAYRLTESGHTRNSGEMLEAALFPIPPWQPKSGFKVDRALIYALMRQESAFNPRAKSRDGARGLMQLMPATASFMARKRYRGSKRNQLFEPSLNLELGQRYVSYLLGKEIVDANLFRLTTAYNAGPGNLARWQRRMKYEDDPLMFIESLPARETRLFIERVLTNFWIYRARLGQPAPSLDAVASGDWPGYAALDGANPEVARFVSGSN